MNCIYPTVAFLTTRTVYITTCFVALFISLFTVTNGYSQTLTVSNALSCSSLSATLTASPACTGPITYQFSGPDNFTLVNTTGVASVTVDGSYSVTAISADGLCTTTASASVSSSLHPDYLPLVDFYNSTNGSSWTNKSGWLTNCDPCSGWFGVTCSGGRVTRLNMLFNKLKGVIPERIANISELENLALPYNELSGTIPTSLSIQSKLTMIWLQDNKLTGSLPENFSVLTNLTIFNVANNQLTGTIPEGYNSLAKLTQFWLASNQLTGTIPSFIGGLPALTSLNLGVNNFSGPIPVELGNLSNLVDLFINGNRLTGVIPNELSNLKKLRNFWLGSNLLTGKIPTYIGSMTTLLSIVIGYNQLSGPIPASIGGLPELNTLVLESNRLSGCIPSSLTALCDRDVCIGNNPGLPNNGDWTAFCANGAGNYTGTLITTKSGYWHDKTVWSCGAVPQAGDQAVIQHPVTLAPVQLNQAGQIRYEPGGRLIQEANSAFKLGW